MPRALCCQATVEAYSRRAYKGPDLKCLDLQLDESCCAGQWTISDFPFMQHWTVYYTSFHLRYVVVRMHIWQEKGHPSNSL